jgi:hypothetical protein
MQGRTSHDNPFRLDTFHGNFAETLETIPFILTETAGVHPPPRDIGEIRAKQHLDVYQIGVHARGHVEDMMKEGALLAKKRIISSATQTAIMIMQSKGKSKET